MSTTNPGFWEYLAAALSGAGGNDFVGSIRKAEDDKLDQAIKLAKIQGLQDVTDFNAQVAANPTNVQTFKGTPMLSPQTGNPLGAAVAAGLYQQHQVPADILLANKYKEIYNEVPSWLTERMKPLGEDYTPKQIADMNRIPEVGSESWMAQEGIRGGIDPMTIIKRRLGLTPGAAQPQQPSEWQTKLSVIKKYASMKPATPEEQAELDWAKGVKPPKPISPTEVRLVKTLVEGQYPKDIIEKLDADNYTALLNNAGASLYGERWTEIPVSEVEKIKKGFFGKTTYEVKVPTELEDMFK